MDEAGMVIFRNGDIIPFGKVVYMDDPEYLEKATRLVSYLS